MARPAAAARTAGPHRASPPRTARSRRPVCRSPAATARGAALRLVPAPGP